MGLILKSAISAVFLQVIGEGGLDLHLYVILGSNTSRVTEVLCHTMEPLRVPNKNIQ